MLLSDNSMCTGTNLLSVGKALQLTGTLLAAAEDLYVERVSQRLIMSLWTAPFQPQPATVSTSIQAQYVIVLLTTSAMLLKSTGRSVVESPLCSHTAAAAKISLVLHCAVHDQGCSDCRLWGILWDTGTLMAGLLLLGSDASIKVFLFMNSSITMPSMICPRPAGLGYL